MKTITIGKKVQVRTISRSELRDILLKLFKHYDIVYRLMSCIISADEEDNRKKPATIIESLWNSLARYSCLSIAEDPNTPEIKLGTPITTLPYYSKGFDDILRSYQIHPSDILIDPTLLLTDLYNPGSILDYNSDASSTYTFNLLSLQDNFKLYKSALPTFREVEIGSTKYLHSSDISQEGLTKLYQALYDLEYRSVYYWYTLTFGDTLIPESKERIKIYPRLLDFASILGLSDVYYNSNVLAIIFTSMTITNLYLQFLSGDTIEAPGIISVLHPVSSHIRLGYDIVEPDSFQDFILRRIYTQKYGQDKYKETGIINLEKELGYDMKGNIYSDIYFGDLLDDSIKQTLMPLVTAFTRKPIRFAWSETLYQLSRATYRKQIELLLEQLMIYVDNIDMEGYLQDKEGNNILCSHRYVVYNNLGVSPDQLETLLLPYKTQIGTEIICRICGEKILSQDNIEIEYTEMERDFVLVEDYELSNIRSITTDVVSSLLKGAKVLGYQTLVSDIAFVIYQEISDILSTLYKNKVLTLTEINEQKTIYVACYAYAMVLKLSNTYSPSGQLVLDTKYTGRRIQEVFPEIISDINRNYSLLIEKYKNIFGGKNLKIIFLNSYKKLHMKIIDDSETGEVKRLPSPMDIIKQQYPRFPSVPSDPDTLDTIREYLYIKAREYLVKLYNTNMSMEYLYIGESPNPFFDDLLDTSLYTYTMLWDKLYILAYPRFVSPNVFVAYMSLMTPTPKYYIGFFYGSELHEHKFQGYKCTICGLTIREIADKMPAYGQDILEERNITFRMNAFYKKYSIVCPTPSYKEMQEGKVTHIYKNNKCTNCGYIKGERDIEYYKKYGIIYEEAEIKPVILDKPPSIPEDIKNWSHNTGLHYELAEKTYKDLSNIGSQDIVRIWLYNIGYEAYYTKQEMLSAYIEASPETPRRTYLIDHIITVILYINMINNPDTAPDYIQEFTSGKKYSLSVELPASTYFLKQIDAEDMYFHDLLMKILLDIPQDVSAFIIQALFKKIQSVARYSDAELYKAKSFIFEYRDDEFDEDIELDKSWYTGMDYEGTNDEFNT